jgi:hypothetical protein
MMAKEQNMNMSLDLGDPPKNARVARIRELNDRLRTTGRGGMVQMTNGVAVLGKQAVNLVFDAVSRFTDFTPDNDPWGEHDCATLKVGDISVIWKIDYYDRSRRIHSPDPADPKVTVRVLTVMLADEY